MYSCARVVRVFYTVFCDVFCQYSTHADDDTSILAYSLNVFFAYSLPVSAAALRTPTGVASLSSVQKIVKRLKVQAGGGLKIVQNVLEFKQLCHPLLMPPTLRDLAVLSDPAATVLASTPPLRIMTIPLDAHDFFVSGQCFIGPQQIIWIGQLGKIPFKFVLHIDAGLLCITVYQGSNGCLRNLEIIGSHRSLPLSKTARQVVALRVASGTCVVLRSTG